MSESALTVAADERKDFFVQLKFYFQDFFVQIIRENWQGALKMAIDLRVQGNAEILF